MADKSSTYLGNKNLKRSAVSIGWNEDMVKEYVKCSKDSLYFIKKYVKIVNVDKGLVPFEPWPFQVEMIKKCIDDRFVIAKMPRQVGKTTTIAALLLWYVLFKDNFSIAILANKERQAREILSRIQLAYEHLPKWLQQGIIEWNKGNIELENGSKILASSTSSSAIRGTSQNLVYLDEFAFVPSNVQEEFFASVYPTISSGQSTKVLITSTPNGMNLFYKIWSESETGKNSYSRVSVHWSQIPGRTEAWKKQTIDNTSERQFKQEYECEFLGSSNTLIDASKLSMLTHALPLERHGNLIIYELPKKKHVYLTVVDTSRGAGIDYSAFIVYDITEIPYKVVARYKDNNIAALVYPNVIYNASRPYNTAYILVETNDIGQQVADILQNDLEYENVLLTRSGGKSGQKLGDSGGGKLSLGVRTTTQVKRIGCANFKSLVESDKIIINDYDLLYEMYRFIEINGKYQAEEGEHDDLVMCCVLFSWLVNQDYFKELSNNDARLELLESNQRKLEEEMLPFGFIDEGLDTSSEDDEFNRFLGVPLADPYEKFII
jgi:hypothetical protein